MSRVTASVCIVEGTEHKASLWTAIYIIKTRAMSLLLLIINVKITIPIEYYEMLV